MAERCALCTGNHVRTRAIADSDAPGVRRTVAAGTTADRHHAIGIGTGTVTDRYTGDGARLGRSTQCDRLTSGCLCVWANGYTAGAGGLGAHAGSQTIQPQGPVVFVIGARCAAVVHAVVMHPPPAAAAELTAFNCATLTASLSAEPAATLMI